MGVFDKNTAKLPLPKYTYITKLHEALDALSYINQFEMIEVDTEGTSLSPFDGKTVLLQLGVQGQPFVFDVRKDIGKSEFDLLLFKDILEDKTKLKLLQNALYDVKMIKHHFNFYINNIYDTMLAEQLINLGRPYVKAALPVLVQRYLGLVMDKEPRGTFMDYNQDFQKYQLEYAALDVCTLGVIRDAQLLSISKHNLERVCQLEFDFIKPMAEMELNGITINTERWLLIMQEVAKKKDELHVQITKTLDATENQTTLFGVSLINIDSPKQLKTALKKYGVELEGTAVEELEKYAGITVVDNILAYRKAEKLISTYCQPLLDKIHPATGRLHTDFKQLMQTGRLSSSNPNLQNIPGKQIYRSCFVSKPGCVLITADMSGAELRIIGNMSQDPVFVSCYLDGIDLHTKSAAGVFNVSYEKVSKEQRKASKAITFGLAYGLSKFGLARRLKISETKAERLMLNYFTMFPKIKQWLEELSNEAVRKGYSETIIGRKRFYDIPKYDSPDRKFIINGVKRQAKNAPIQGCIVSDSKINGLGSIGNYVGETLELETGFGKDLARCVYSGKKDVYDLMLSNGANLGITLTHKIPVVNNTGLIEKTVESINFDEDYLLIPLNVVEGKPTNVSGFKYEKGHWRETYKHFELPTVMSEKLAFILGCLIGDGSYTKHNHFRFVCPEYHYELLEQFNKCVESVFGYKPIVKLLTKGRKTGIYTSQVSSVVVRGFLKHIGLGYVKHHDKSIPEYFYSETSGNKGALLKALFSTDGGMTADSGPNFTTVSKVLANDVHQLLFSLGINANLKTTDTENGPVYRVQIPKRFNAEFKKFVGFSIKEKNALLEKELMLPKFGDGSIVPPFIPKSIERVLRKSPTYFKDFTTQEKAHLRRFKLGKCSYSSWRKFYDRLPVCEERKVLSQFLNFDFCKADKITHRGEEDTYDLMCDSIHYFTANGIIVHNSNADTIKQAMIFLVERLETLPYYAKLLLTVHDELIVECDYEHRYEVAKIVEQTIKDGFNMYFKIIPMETDALISYCWMKGSCDKDKGGCGGQEFKFESGGKYGQVLTCATCGKEQ